MSEYWKSTPRYWCKFCKVYVRDTKLERQNHEATGKHQGNVQRGIKDIHRANDREEREKQRAKDEVARLTGAVGGAGRGLGSVAAKPSAPPPPKQQASIEDRKRQMAQLSAMGIAIPEEFRKEFAVAGEWQTVRTLPPKPSQEESAERDTLAADDRKRRIGAQKDEDEDGDDEKIIKRRKGWGNTFKTYPGSKMSGDDDMDTLLGGPIKLKYEPKDTSLEDPDDSVKQEEPDEEQKALEPSETQQLESDIKPEEHGKPSIMPPTVKAEELEKPPIIPPGTGIVFKKRKSKPVREK